MRAAVGWIGQVLAWLVILSVVVVLAAAVLVPRLAGATPYTVLTGSMTPDYPPGTLVVVKAVDPEDLRVGDVVTYQLESGDATVVAHRVVTISTDLEGEVGLTTQGDANNVPDAVAVRPVQVKGRLWYSAPYLGHVNHALNGSQRQFVVYGVGGVLLAYAAYLFTGALRDRSRDRRQGVPSS